MLRLQIIVLCLLPHCFGQFSIQGPSDGNRRAQGLKFTQDKGVEFTHQAESQGSGGFSIQGASDGNSDFVIQGATDGNSDFRIQGATDGNSDFQIHGPTDGGSQAYIHNYDSYQEQPQQSIHQNRAVNYEENEPAPRPAHRRPAHRRSQAHAARLQQQQQQQQQEHQQQQQQQQQHRQQLQAQQQQQALIANVNYNPIDKAPPSIQEILQFQAQIPYVNIIPEHLRVDVLSTAHEQAKKFAEEYPKQYLAQNPPQVIIEEAPRNQYRARPRPPNERQRERRQAPTQYTSNENQRAYAQRQQIYAQQQAYARRQAPQYDSYQRQLYNPQEESEAPQQYDAYQQQQQQQAYSQQLRRQAPRYEAYQRQQAYAQQEQQPQEQAQEQQQQFVAPSAKAYRRVNQPPAEPAPHYSSSVPQQIQQILRYQAQIPYDVIANQIIYRPDKPYVHQPTHGQQQQQQQAHPAAPVPAQYKPEASTYQQRYQQPNDDVVYSQKQQYQSDSHLALRPAPGSYAGLQQQAAASEQIGQREY